jgi:hypothetical protein
VSFRFIQRIIWGRRKEVCIIKQSQTKYGLVDYYLNSDSAKGSGVVIAVIT